VYVQPGKTQEMLDDEAKWLEHIRKQREREQQNSEHAVRDASSHKFNPAQSMLIAAALLGGSQSR
jgi:hypothetical protein